MQRFQKFLREDCDELLEAEGREGGGGKASQIIGALASGNLTKAMAQMTSFGVAPMTEATVNTRGCSDPTTTCHKDSTT